MIEFSDCNWDSENEFISSKQAVNDCRQEKTRSSNCLSCASVMSCDKLSNFISLQFQRSVFRLKKCQENNSIKSCWNCDKAEVCTIKKEYIDATYQKMNSGRGGEFDF